MSKSKQPGTVEREKCIEQPTRYSEIQEAYVDAGVIDKQISQLLERRPQVEGSNYWPTFLRTIQSTLDLIVKANDDVEASYE